MANVRMETANCSQKQMFPWCSRFWFRAHDFQSHFEVFGHRNVEPTLQQVVMLIDSSQQLTSQRILNILISFCYFYSKITLYLSRAHLFSKSPINLANNFGSYLSQQCFWLSVVQINCQNIFRLYWYLYGKNTRTQGHNLTSSQNICKKIIRKRIELLIIHNGHIKCRL